MPFLDSGPGKLEWNTSHWMAFDCLHNSVSHSLPFRGPLFPMPWVSPFPKGLPCETVLVKRKSTLQSLVLEFGLYEPPAHTYNVLFPCFAKGKMTANVHFCGSGLLHSHDGAWNSEALVQIPFWVKTVGLVSLIWTLGDIRALFFFGLLYCFLKLPVAKFRSWFCIFFLNYYLTTSLCL